MVLLKLELKRGYGWTHDIEKPLEGEATFQGKNGEIKIRIGEEAARKIVKLCAEGIVECAKEVSMHMTAETLQHAAALEHKA